MRSPTRTFSALGLFAATFCVASAPIHASGRPNPPRVTPICGDIGLADVALADPTGRWTSVDLIVSSAEGGPPVRIRMERGAPSADGGSGDFKARVYAGRGAEGALLARLEGIDAAGRREIIAESPIESAPDALVHVPEWALGAVWYQVFPERFRNGNPANDPRGAGVFAARWDADWRSVSADELEAKWERARADPLNHGGTARRDLFMSVVHARRYGGDLEGLEQALPHIQDLGATAIYLNPVFHAASLHKYDASDFRHIDPTLAGPGPEVAEEALVGEGVDAATWRWTPADRYVVDTLLPAARARGLRVVFDGVWNHIGREFWAFRDVIERGRDSAYASWFDCRFADERMYPDWRTSTLDVTPGRLIGWSAWDARNGRLPTFSRSAEGRLHPEVERHIFDVTSRWMAPDGEVGRGIDGWRLDVAPDVPLPFWRAWREHVRAINPDAVLIGEIWFPAAERLATRTDEQGLAGPFDAQTNYPVGMPLVAWLNREPRMTGQRLTARLDDALDVPPQTQLTQMNLLNSHDTARLATMLANPGREYDQDSGIVGERRGYFSGRPGGEVYDRVVLGVALLVALPGSPMVFAGDEFGMSGADDPDCRKPLPWPDLPANVNPDDRPVDGLPERFRAWLRLRSEPEVGAVLRFGSHRWRATGSPDVVAVERRLNNRTVLVVANRADDPFEATELVPPGARAIEVEARSGGGTRVPPRSAGVWTWEGS